MGKRKRGARGVDGGVCVLVVTAYGWRLIASDISGKSSVKAWAAQKHIESAPKQRQRNRDNNALDQ